MRAANDASAGARVYTFVIEIGNASHLSFCDFMRNQLLRITASSCSQALTEIPIYSILGASPNRHSGEGKMDEAQLLKQTPLFKNLSADDIERIAQSTRIQNYKADQTIVIEGRVGAAFFIVVSGSVEVFKRRKDSNEVVLATLGAGEFFGELATMKHVPRSANVRALQDTTCLVIRRADFESYIRQFPDVAEEVESTLVARFGEELE